MMAGYLKGGVAAFPMAAAIVTTALAAKLIKKRSGEPKFIGDHWNRSRGFVRLAVHRTFFWPALDRRCIGHAVDSTLVLGDRGAVTAEPEAVAGGLAPVVAGRDIAAGGTGCGKT